MKKSVIYILISLLVIACSNKNKGVRINNEFEIAGKIKSFKEFTFRMSEFKDTISIKNYTFNKENQIIKIEDISYRHEYFITGSKIKITSIDSYQYDNENIISIKTKANFETIPNKNKEQNKINQLKKYYYTNHLLDSTTIINSDNNTIIAIEKYNYKNGKLINSIIKENSYDVFWEKSKLKYDDNGLLIKQLDLEHKQKNLLIRDNNGLVKEYLLDGNKFLVEYTFDKNGNWVTAKEYLDGTLTRYKKRKIIYRD